MEKEKDWFSRQLRFIEEESKSWPSWRLKESNNMLNQDAIVDDNVEEFHSRLFNGYLDKEEFSKRYDELKEKDCDWVLTISGKGLGVLEMPFIDEFVEKLTKYGRKINTINFSRYEKKENTDA